MRLLWRLLGWHRVTLPGATLWLRGRGAAELSRRLLVTATFVRDASGLDVRLTVDLTE